jgi:two-component system, cell cycle response regulator DivK
MAKILIAEDERDIRDLITFTLGFAGYVAVAASNGEEAVNLARQEMPDLILMDVALGDMDGWEATRLIKANPQTAAIPIIALTAHALASARETSVQVGCSEFDTKPVDLPRLLGKINHCLAQSVAAPGAS